jgi:hypothetical protein
MTELSIKLLFKCEKRQQWRFWRKAMTNKIVLSQTLENDRTLTSQTNWLFVTTDNNLQKITREITTNWKHLNLKTYAKKEEAQVRGADFLLLAPLAFWRGALAGAAAFLFVERPVDGPAAGAGGGVEAEGAGGEAAGAFGALGCCLLSVLDGASHSRILMAALSAASRIGGLLTSLRGLRGQNKIERCWRK